MSDYSIPPDILEPDYLETTFYLAIDQLVQKHGCSHIEACVHYAEKHGLEVEILAPMIEKSAKLRAGVQKDAEDLKYLKRSVRLPI
jgi:hypothetical protein